MRGDLTAALRAGCILLTVFSISRSTPWRQRRQVQSTYIIDAQIVVDNVAYSRFQNWMNTTSPNASITDVENKLKEYVSLLIHQTNVRLATLQPPYNFSIQVVDIQLNKPVLDNLTKSSSNEVSANSSLETFRTWIISSGYQLKYDHSILLTGYSFQNDSYESSTKGRAYVGKMWDTSGYSVSVVQESGGFQSSYFIAHELVHSLGSRHDGDDASSKCSPQDGFIMSSTRSAVGPQTNAWYYSNCTIDVVKKWMIDALALPRPTSGSNNYSSSLNPISEFSSTLNVAAGQRYTADVQCQMMYGSKSRVCLGNSFVNISGICMSMFCLDQTTQASCSGPNFAAEGTSCGDKKWCRMGRCESSADAPVLDTSCPNGDGVDKVNGQTCTDAIKTNIWLCYNENVTRNCCRSCELARRSSATCPYGDKVGDCTKALCSTSNADQCCETCQADRVTVIPCVDVAYIDHVTCKLRTKMGDHQECYNATVASQCCQTCSQYKTNKAGCEYGDRYLDGRCSTTTDRVCDRKECCGSCNTGTSILWSSTPFSSVLVILVLFTEFVQYFI